MKLKALTIVVATGLMLTACKPPSAMAPPGTSLSRGSFYTSLALGG